MSPRIAALLLLLLAAVPSAAAPSNVIVIDVCSARADHFGAYGGPAGLTPGLDAFAREAATFENAWAQSSWCLPNYAALLTGHRPEVDGLLADAPYRRLPDWEITLASRLKDAGYRTAAFSSGAHDLQTWALDRGFDHYEDHFSTDEAQAGRFSLSVPGLEKWIAGGGPKPFFVYATVDDLHTPYQSDEPAAPPALDTATLSVEFFRAYDAPPPPAGTPMAARLAAFRADPRSLPAVEARYRAALRSVDRTIAAFLADLKARGEWEKTVVIVTADHGESLGEHGLLGHTEGLFEPVLHVPLFIRVPGAKAARVPALTERVDLAPTILALAGAGADGMELQGRSLAPLLSNPAAPWRRIAYASSKRQQPGDTGWEIDERAVRDERWKLMWSAAAGRWRLFDLKDDPGETRDLAAERADVVARLSFDMLTETENARTHAAGRPSGR